MSLVPHRLLLRSLAVAAIFALVGCAVAPPRTDDPWEGFNRKTFAFNREVDKIAIRPVAEGYRKVTPQPLRTHVNDFFSNILLPVTVANELLQGKPKRALETSGRFLVNLTVGFLGFFDPASHFGIPDDNTDFGVTLARWGVPEGPYLVLPLVGPTTTRDFWRLPVDSYAFNPISIYGRNHDYRFDQQYLPSLAYLVTLRSRAMNAEGFLQSAYDPYTFMRDAYRQHRLYMNYYGNPPDQAIERMQGLDQPGFDPDKLLEQQHKWQQENGGSQPAKGASAAPPATPATASSSGM